MAVAAENRRIDVLQALSNELMCFQAAVASLDVELELCERGGSCRESTN